MDAIESKFYNLSNRKTILNLETLLISPKWNRINLISDHNKQFTYGSHPPGLTKQTRITSQSATLTDNIFISKLI